MQNDKKLTQNLKKSWDTLLKRAYDLRDKCSELTQEIIASSEQSPIKGYVSEEKFNEVLKLQEEYVAIEERYKQYKALQEH